MHRTPTAEDGGAWWVCDLGWGGLKEEKDHQQESIDTNHFERRKVAINWGLDWGDCRVTLFWYFSGMLAKQSRAAHVGDGRLSLRTKTGKEKEEGRAVRLYVEVMITKPLHSSSFSPKKWKGHERKGRTWNMKHETWKEKWRILSAVCFSHKILLNILVKKEHGPQFLIPHPDLWSLIPDVNLSFFERQNRWSNVDSTK
jgi:hypothetical protein